jgi:hypothetical protein
MRTTVTLDPDVAALIEAERARTDESFRAATNRLLRRVGPRSARYASPHLPGSLRSTWPTSPLSSLRWTTSGVRIEI